MGADPAHRYSEPACCRNCGKPGGAIMMPGYCDHWVCSEACSIRLAHKLAHGMGQPKYGDPPDGLQNMILASWMGEPRDHKDRILDLRIRIKQLANRVKERDEWIAELIWLHGRSEEVLSDANETIGELMDDLKRADEEIRDLQYRDY